MKRHRTPLPHFMRDPSHPAWRDLALTSLPIALFCAAVVAVFVWLVDPSPPRTITISAGPRDSSFMQMAQAYSKILARNGVTLKVLESDGSVQNLQRLLDPKSKVDLAFVQGGVADGFDTRSLVSLGSVAYLPIVVFYRGSGLTQLSQLDGKRIAIGRVGSGTRELSLKLLAANDIEPGGDSTFLPLDGMEAATALVSNRVEAAMLSGDSTTRELMQRLLGIPGISVMSFDESAAYTRLFPYLESIDLPPGVLDLRHRMPPQTVHLIGPTVEIAARNTLHPAISDLIVEAAGEVNGVPGLLQRAGEFPSPAAHDFRISEDATRYYKSGKSFLYRTLPFWLASVADRLLVLLLPLAVLVFPALRAIPALYRWRVRSRIYRYYGALIAIERDALKHSSDEERRALIAELDEIERALNTLRMPLAYADAFYVLREHVGFVRMHLAPGARPSEGAGR
ncbi:TAXI family TRAP transporter solute-binding subunit [Paraburkholderia sacchari]|uniref:TAXI family TRAP transporter solute-binding subunit n=1 Tax=Paraburkholderia sacchari TaxID=159450 RepID=UPI0039A5013E